ncbi:uncharacterized protein METZ01_LOCUS463169, partial [marine metagenome]
MSIDSASFDNGSRVVSVAGAVINIE